MFGLFRKRRELMVEKRTFADFLAEVAIDAQGELAESWDHEKLMKQIAEAASDGHRSMIVNIDPRIQNKVFPILRKQGLHVQRRYEVSGVQPHEVEIAW